MNGVNGAQRIAAAFFFFAFPKWCACKDPGLAVTRIDGYPERAAFLILLIAAQNNANCSRGRIEGGSYKGTCWIDATTPRRHDATVASCP